MGRIMVIGGTKGGTGKSTITRNLAVFAAMEPIDLCMVDADPQHTVTNWVSRRSERKPQIFTVELTSPKLPNGLPDPRGIAPRLLSLADRHELVLVDCGGRDSAELRSALLVADVLITPFFPSLDDVETLGALMLLVQEIELHRGRSLPTLAITSRAHPNKNTKSTRIAHETLADYKEYMTVANTVVCQRDAHQKLAAEGMAVGDNPSLDANAYTEMKRAYDEIFGGIYG